VLVSVVVPAAVAVDVYPIKVAIALGAVVEFVPPFATANVPATVTAPEVAVEGVKPVVPKESVVTPSATLVATFTKSDPSHAAKHLSPDTMVTPVVGPAPRSTTEPVPALITT